MVPATATVAGLVLEKKAGLGRGGGAAIAYRCQLSTEVVRGVVIKAEVRQSAGMASRGQTLWTEVVGEGPMGWDVESRLLKI